MTSLGSSARLEALPCPGERFVSCRLVFNADHDTLLALQVAPARSAGVVLDEELVVTTDGYAPDGPAFEVPTDAGGRIHLVPSRAGELVITYRAIVLQPPVPVPAYRPDYDSDAIVGLRQSRYCPSDQLAPFAAHELGYLRPNLDPADVAAWVFDRLDYRGGASGPLDTAVDTLLAGAGVCRDFAHLTISMCRALGIPARLLACYAPGLFPMDFHAVAEVWVAGQWQVFDATRLAPRQSLVRIATGRDAADTAFATTLRGDVGMVFSEITAVHGDDLQLDDHVTPVRIA